MSYIDADGTTKLRLSERDNTCYLDKLVKTEKVARNNTA